MPKLVLRFPAVEENWKWLPQEGGQVWSCKALSCLSQERKREGERMASDDPHSCHLPIPPVPSLQRWQTKTHRKNAQWVLGHFAVLRCLLPSITSPRPSLESYLSYFAVLMNYELFQLHLDKILLAHLQEQSPAAGHSVECWLSGEPCLLGHPSPHWLRELGTNWPKTKVLQIAWFPAGDVVPGWVDFECCITLRRNGISALGCQPVPHW